MRARSPFLLLLLAVFLSGQAVDASKQRSFDAPPLSGPIGESSGGDAEDFEIEFDDDLEVASFAEERVEHPGLISSLERVGESADRTRLLNQIAARPPPARNV
ncbi:MAG: hypothetical protein AAFX06_17160 [Planctomycetota bacterium]